MIEFTTRTLAWLGWVCDWL